jgi:hypothetical protein
MAEGDGAIKMIRRERRKARAMSRKPLKRFGVPIHSTVIGAVLDTPDGPKTVFYWFATEDFPDRSLTPEEIAAKYELHGPFNTPAEADADAKVAVVGEECEITEGGMWDPAWERLQ